MSASSSSSASALDKVTKLETSVDWNDHKREIDNWLILRDMMDLIEEYPTIPHDGVAPHNAGRTLITNWKKAQRQALAAIDNRLGERARDLKKGLTTYHTLYDVLEKNFKPQGDGHFGELSHQLMNISLSSFNSLEEMTSEFKLVQSKLANLSPHAAIPNCWAIQWYLNALSSAYDTFKTSLSHAGNILPTDEDGLNGLSFDTVILKAITEEKNIRFRDDKISLSMVSYTPGVEIQKSYKETLASLPPPQPIPGTLDHVMAATKYCIFCKRLGHVELQCITKDPSKTKYSRNRKNNGGGHQNGGSRGGRSDNSKKPKTENSEERSAELTMVALSDTGVASTEVGLSAASSQPQIHYSRSILANSWGVDSMCSLHITHLKEAFTSYTPISPSRAITGIGGTICRPRGKGTVRLQCKNQHGELISINFTNVYHVPEAGANLFSLGLLMDRGFNVAFVDKNIVLSAKGQDFTANRRGNVWFLNVE